MGRRFVGRRAAGHQHAPEIAADSSAVAVRPVSATLLMNFGDFLPDNAWLSLKTHPAKLGSLPQYRKTLPATQARTMSGVPGIAAANDHMDWIFLADTDRRRSRNS